MSESTKRYHSPPTGATPGKKPPKRHMQENVKKTSRKSLFQTGTVIKKKNDWSYDEISSLVEYVALYHAPDEASSTVWPTHKNEQFWNKCAEAVNCSNQETNRTGGACRDKVRRFLKEKFETIEEAEDEYNICYFNGGKTSSTPNGCAAVSPQVHSDQFTHVQSPLLGFSPLCDTDVIKLPGCILDVVSSGFKKLTSRQREQLLVHLFHVWINSTPDCLNFGTNFVPYDFLPLVMKAMSVLQSAGKDNIIYHAARCYGEKRPGMDIPRLPLDRMPFGLIAHNLKFFASDDVKFLEAPGDYKSWFQSLYTLFGNKWASMHLGPLWSYELECGDVSLTSNTLASTDILSQALQESFGDDFELLNSSTDSFANDSDVVVAESRENTEDVDEDVSVTNDSVHVGRIIRGDPLQAKVNIAGPSSRTIRRMNLGGDFNKSAKIQVAALKHLHTNYPNGRWWIKADGTDLQEGLRESVKNIWSGDVDFGDGDLEKRHAEYISYLKFVRCVGLNSRAPLNCIEEDLKLQLAKLNNEKEFLTSAHIEAKKLYDKLRQTPSTSENSMFASAWNLEEYSALLNKNQSLMQSATSIIHIIESGCTHAMNIRSAICSLRNNLVEYVKGVSSKKREAASHILIFMLSEEKRNFKPYAVPVWVVKYHSLTDKKMRELNEEMKSAMEDIGMVSVGFVSDGEFNSLRTQGSKRPVSVIQIMMDAKNEARGLSAKQIEKFFLPIEKDGTIVPSNNHKAIPLEDVQFLAELMNGESKMSFGNAIFILRRKNFPFSHDPHPWIEGKTETKADCLKFLMAIYLFKMKIDEYCKQDINFREHLYVPEVSEKTGEPQHHREDHNHVLKRIAGSLRKGHIPNINLQAFVKAMHDPHTGLTYTALTGKRKQSVGDAEKLLSPAVAKWLKLNGYDEEARFVESVSNWHKASDGRGLSEETRSEYNLAMLDYLLEDWMPWFRENRDFSTLDPNRPIRGIRGLTREVIVALTTNIESQEFRRQYGKKMGLEPEHPRAGSSDDVEGIFALLHGMLGSIFDEKAFHDAFPKVINEYTKQCDPHLPFYHYTGSNDRFNDGRMVSFNVPSVSGVERLDEVRISRRADPGVFVTNRAVIPQRGKLTVRAAQFKPAESLPPPPTPQLP